MKAWAACYPLHFTIAYIVYRESRTRQVVKIHVHYGVHHEIYTGIDSRLINLSLCQTDTIYQPVYILCWKNKIRAL